MAYVEIEQDFFRIFEVKPMRLNDTQLVQLLLLAINMCYFSIDKFEPYTKAGLRYHVMEELICQYLYWKDTIAENRGTAKMQKQIVQLKEKVDNIWELKQNR